MTARGKIFLTLLILGVVGFGAWKWRDTFAPSNGGGTKGATAPGKSGAETTTAGLVETQTEVPHLATPGTYLPKENN